MGIFLPSVEGSTPRVPQATRGVPEVDSRHTRGNNPCARARTKVLALLFVRREVPIRMREVPLGMLVTYTNVTPWDDCPIRKVMVHGRLVYCEHLLNEGRIESLEASHVYLLVCSLWMSPRNRCH